jgi:hypothetical protein
VGSGLLIGITRMTFSKEAPNAIAALSFPSRPRVWFGNIIMAPIERVFIAMAVIGFMGLIATVAWLMVS